MSNEVMPQDGEHERLYELAMRGTSCLIPVEAAVWLVFQVEELRDWLVGNGFVPMVERPDSAYAVVDFARALETLWEPRQAGRESLQDGLSESSKGVLIAAANLSGLSTDPLRHSIQALEYDEARLVAQAVMYAAGFMDGSADPFGNEVPNDGTGAGPHAAAHEKRWSSQG
ncbi:hypothetical protein [Kitasatospora sp. Root107]|uniref:hypothetical protein n=1 Tax=Kitasatospora sp. Root107 TaxID=1736424 RepID=UPI000B0DDD3F|nr:hypothetical protein [Kitasatospora sp. Root107]